MAKGKLRRHSGKVIGSASWMALLAAASLGGIRAETVRAQIRVPPNAVTSGQRYRLVVQSYDPVPEGNGSGRSRGLRGSMQRAVTGEDLVQGIAVDLLELSQGTEEQRQRGVVIAWAEPGEPDLEFDGRAARPTAGSVFGRSVTPSALSPVEIVLDTMLAVG